MAQKSRNQSERNGILAFCGLTCFTGLAFAVAIEGIGRYTSNLVRNAKQKPVIEQRDVLGNKQPETFYEINGQRAYLKIDGKNVEDYVRER